MKIILLSITSVLFINLYSQDTIILWNFNNENLIASKGFYKGQIYNIGDTNTGWAQGNSINVNDRSWEITSFPNQSSNFTSGSAGIEIQVNTRGYENVIICFDQWADGDASRWVQADYSPDGGVCWHIADWTNEGELSPHGQFYSFSIDLSSIDEANDNEDFRIRLTSSYSPMAFYERPFVAYDSHSAYMRANATTVYQNELAPTEDTGSYNPNATWRFDNVVVKGEFIAPLPVKLIDFDVVPHDGYNLVQYSTAQEINNDFFIVERSEDGRNFYKIEKVKGQGNSNELHHYKFEDFNLISAISYYKVLQVDYDGSIESSEIKMAINKNDSEVKVWPTVSDSEVVIKTNYETYDIELTDNLGRLVKVINYLRYNSHIDISDLPNGQYYLNVKVGHTYETFKVVKP